MEVITTVNDLEIRIKELAGKTIGFVPTMGFLHDGHLSLVKAAKQENAVVIMSIFVNPLQFGPDEDFDLYPRDELRDSRIAEENGVTILFIPQVAEMYPNDFAINMQVENEQVNVLCGRSRIGHFDGVITVLTKLFNLVQPTNVYFGLKDAQQFAIVNTLIASLNFPIHLVGLPTVRESDGLAKSSRNVYLSETERVSAISLSKALKLGQQLLVDGMKNHAIIINEVSDYILNNTSATIDYIELLHYPSLTEITSPINGQVVLAVAVHFKKARLIDNIILQSNGAVIDRIN